MDVDEDVVADVDVDVSPLRCFHPATAASGDFTSFCNTGCWLALKGVPPVKGVPKITPLKCA